MFSKTKISHWSFIKTILFSQSSTDNLKFILFRNLFNSVIMNIFKLRRSIFICDSILLCSFLRLFKSQKMKKHSSKTRSRRSEWLCIYFIKRHIDSRSFNKIIDYWVCVFFNDEKYYWYMIENKFLFVNSIINSLLWSLERLLFFYFKNNFLFELIEFMINLSNHHLEHLCCSKFLIIFPKSSMNVLKEIQSLESLKSFSFNINIFNFEYLSWYSTVNFIWWWLTKYFLNRNIINSPFFNLFNVSISLLRFYRKRKIKLLCFSVRLTSWRQAKYFVNSERICFVLNRIRMLCA